MQHVNEPDHLIQSISPAEPSTAMTARPAYASRGMRTTAMVGLIVLLAVVFGTGLFAGWVYGTRSIDPLFQTPANGVGFAIPSNRVRFIAQQFIETGKVMHTGRAALGIQMTNVDAALAAQNHLAVASGVLIVPSIMMKEHRSPVRRAIVIHSPHARRSASLSHALTALERAGVEIVEVLPISIVANALALGQQWKANGIDLVVAAGGDGLVGSVTMHVLDGQLPLGIIPLGTANDLARSVGIPQDISSAAQVIASGTYRAIDLGLARSLMFGEPSASHTSPRPSQHRLFAHALTVGLSVQFAHFATNKAIRQRYGHLTYPFALWQAFKTYQPIDAEIHFQDVVPRRTPSSSLPIVARDHLILRSRIAQVTAVNAPIFWGVFEGSVPGVSLTDRTLDIVIFEETSRYQLALRMLHFFTSRYQHSPGKHGWHAQYPELLPVELTDIPGIHHVQARSVTIFTENEPQAVTLDGEVYTQTPVEARVADEQLRLLVPDTLVGVRPETRLRLRGPLAYGSRQSGAH